MSVAELTTNASSGRLATLPRTGRAIIASDFHGHFMDFAALLRSTRLVERLEAGEELYFLLTGDVPDTTRHRYFDPKVPPDGDVLILDQLLALHERFPGRIIYLEGNHDFHVERLHREVMNFVLQRNPGFVLDQNCAIPQELLAGYYDDYRQRYGDALFFNNVAPYDMLARVTGRELQFLTQGPILAHLPGARVLVTHAGPLRADTYPGVQELPKLISELDRARLDESDALKYYASPFHQLLNHRFPNGDYDLKDLSLFCQAFDSTLLVSGHTPLSYLEPQRGRATEACVLRDGLGLIGEQQVVLCTSFGALSDETKVYIELDLSEPVTGANSLRIGHEIRLLRAGAAQS